MPSTPQLSESHINTVDATVSTIATRWGMAGGAAGSVYGWLTSNGTAIFIGIVITFLGFVVNFYFQRRRDKREEDEKEFLRTIELAREQRAAELHAAQMAAIKNNIKL